MKMKNISVPGPAQPANSSAASSAPEAACVSSAARISRRRSVVSAKTPAGRGEQEHRQEHCGLHRGGEEVRASQLDHHPGRRHHLHRVADEVGAAAVPQRAELAMAQRAPDRRRRTHRSDCPRRRARAMSGPLPARQCPHSAVIFRSTITFAQIFDSSAMYFASSSRVPGAGNSPARVSSSRPRRLQHLHQLLIPALEHGAGMREEATKAYQFVAVKPFSPASETVGRSGRKGARARPVVASGISLPR